MWKRFIFTLMGIMATQVVVANCTFSSRGNGTCLLVSSKDKAMTYDLSLTLQDKFDVVIPPSFPDPRSNPIKPGGNIAQSYTDVHTYIIDEMWRTYVFKKLSFNLKSIFVDGKKIPLTNCQMKITNKTVSNYAGKEVQMVISKPGERYVCQIKTTPISHCHDAEVLSMLSPTRGVFFDTKEDLCLSVINKTNQSFYSGDREMQMAFDESEPVNTMSGFTFSKPLSNGGFLPYNAHYSSEVTLRFGRRDLPVQGCQLRIDSHLSQYQNKLINFQVKKNGAGYLCSQLVSELPKPPEEIR